MILIVIGHRIRKFKFYISSSIIVFKLRKKELDVLNKCPTVKKYFFNIIRQFNLRQHLNSYLVGKSVQVLIPTDKRRLSDYRYVSNVIML